MVDLPKSTCGRIAELELHRNARSVSVSINVPALNNCGAEGGGVFAPLGAATSRYTPHSLVLCCVSLVMGLLATPHDLSATRWSVRGLDDCWHVFSPSERRWPLTG